MWTVSRECRLDLDTGFSQWVQKGKMLGVVLSTDVRTGILAEQKLCVKVAVLKARFTWQYYTILILLDLRSIGCGFKSYLGQRCVTTLGKLFTPACLCHQAV